MESDLKANTSFLKKQCKTRHSANNYTIGLDLRCGFLLCNEFVPTHQSSPLLQSGCRPGSGTVAQEMRLLTTTKSSATSAAGGGPGQAISLNSGERAAHAFPAGRSGLCCHDPVGSKSQAHRRWWQVARVTELSELRTKCCICFPRWQE